MAYTNLPEIFSARLKENYEKALVFGSMANRDYEGEVIGGGSVKILQFGDVTIGDYDTSTGLGDAEQVGNTPLSVLINQQKSFNFRVDSIEKVQRNLQLLERHMANAAQKLAQTHDTYISSLYTQAHADNFIGTDAAPITVSTPSDAYDYLVALGQKLDEKDVPKDGRAVAVTPAFTALLRKDSRFTLNAVVLANGVIGSAAGFSIKETNLAPKVTSGTANTKIIAAHISAITFAEQLQELVKYNPEKFFGDAVKGLSVFGASVVHPEGIAVLSMAN